MVKVVKFYARCISLQVLKMDSSDLLLFSMDSPPSAVLDIDNLSPLKRDGRLDHLVGGEHEGRPVTLQRGKSAVLVGTLSMRQQWITPISHQL